MPSFPIYVMQDGGVFYVYNNSDRENLLFTREAPFKVPCFDMEAAKKARIWFTQLCGYGQKIIWHSFDDEIEDSRDRALDEQGYSL